MRPVCVITFRSTSPERLRNLRCVLQWLDRLDAVETIVVEQDDRPTLDARALPPCRVVFARNPGPFNKSWGFNVGARMAMADVLVLADADLLVNPRHLSDALRACTEGYEVVRPWTDVVDLTEEETQCVVDGRVDVVAHLSPERRGRGHLGEHPPLCGGLYVIRRDTYERLGGQDERFCGWGGEDDAMSLKVSALCAQIAVVRGGLAYHLHHPRHAALPVDDADYQRNLTLLREYRTFSTEALALMCDIHRQTMGDSRRFR